MAQSTSQTKHSPSTGALLLFVGSCNRPTPYFAEANGEGISVFSFDPETAEAKQLCVYDAIENPTFLTVSKDGRRVYANSELFGWPQGVVTSLAFDTENARLSHLDMIPSGGSITAHNALSQDETQLLVANYALGHDGPDRSISVFPLGAKGVLGQATCQLTFAGKGTDPDRQERSHAHFIRQLPNGLVLVCDLGRDLVLSYRLTGAGELEVASSMALPPGTGPRHLAVRDGGASCFVSCELSSAVHSFAVDAASGELRPLSSVKVVPPDKEDGNHCSDIQVSPDGHFLYVANRGADTISILRASPTGELALLDQVSCRGKTPRHLGLSPCGRWLLSANQDSDIISVFRRDAEEGWLSWEDKAITAGTPMCVKFGPRLG